MNEMTEKIRISFEEPTMSEPLPLVVIYNPRALSFALLSQVMRFGLGYAGAKTRLSGRLKGNRKAFTEMIQSYGAGIELVRAPDLAPSPVRITSTPA